MRVLVEAGTGGLALAVVAADHLVDDGFRRVSVPGLTGRFRVFFALVADMLHKGHADFIGNRQRADRHAGQYACVFDAGRMDTFTQHGDAFIDEGAKHA